MFMLIICIIRPHTSLKENIYFTLPPPHLHWPHPQGLLVSY